jgi:hypothetical protein
MLAAFDIIHLNPRFVEIAIALTICYISLENILHKKIRKRSLLTFVFGFIHGFGFANVLQEIAIPRSNLVSSLLSFRC